MNASSHGTNILLGLVGWTVESLILMSCNYNNNDNGSMLKFPSLTKKTTQLNKRSLVRRMWSFYPYSLALLLTLFPSQHVKAYKIYPVYFDPNDEPNRNPRGDGYVPVGPDDWDLVNDYSELFNWEAHSNVDYGGINNCSASTSFQHWGTDAMIQQSPIIVDDNPYWDCNDRHTTHNYAGSGCSYKFYTTPYALRVEFDCDEDWHMDMSRTTTWWNITYVEIKTPSENVIGNGDGYPGTYTRYPAEMVIAHKGDKFHSDRLSFVSIMLDDGGSDDEDLDPFIAGWETFQSNQYESCGVEYDDTNCKLTSTSRRLGKKSEKSVGRNSQQKGTEDLLNTLDDSIMQEMEEQSKRKLAEDYLYPYRLAHKTGPGYYYAYDGSLTVPPCTEIAWWRVLAHPLQVSSSQIQRLEGLVAKHLNSKCKLGTVGKKRNDGTCSVNVNRPLQYTSPYNHVTDCSEWYQDDSVR